MIAILWSLLGAVTYGTSDFIGAVASRKSSAWPVAFATSIGAAITAALLATETTGSPSAGAYGWAAIAGVGGGLGIAFLYRGLAAGRVSAVAPTSAVCAAALPVFVSTLSGEHPPALAWLGIAVALPGIWMVSQEKGAIFGGPGLTDGLLAGVGFGVSFIGFGHVHDTAGWWPLAAANVVSAVAIWVVASRLKEPVLTRQPAVLLGLGGGVLSAIALVGFIRASSRGLVSIAAVLVSLYPAVTIMLAVAIFHERIQRIQRLGLGLCAVAVALVSLSGRG